jgi:hypothetical protein
MNIKTAVFWDGTPCSLVVDYQNFFLLVWLLEGEGEGRLLETYICLLETYIFLLETYVCLLETYIRLSVGVVFCIEL